MERLSLHGLTEELEAMNDLIDQDLGEIDDTKEELIKEFESLLTDKTGSIVEYFENQRDQVSIAKNKIKELKEFIDKKERAMESFSNYVKYCMEKMGRKSIGNGIYKISLSKPSKKLPNEIDIDKLKQKDIFGQFIKKTTTEKIDRVALLAHLKNEKNQEEFEIRLIDSEVKPKFGLKKAGEV